MQDIVQQFLRFIPSALAVVLVILAYRITQRLMTKSEKRQNGSTLVKQTVLFTIGFIGLFFVLLTLPIDSETRGQIMSLLGIVLAASISLSSTSLLGNAMAGLNISLVNSFKVGDFIRTDQIFGRVTTKGLFHTEIQTENRDLMTIPNLYLSTNPVKVTRSSGTIVSTSVSLGYDVSRIVIEDTLKKAALKAGLTDPFVFITELGDFSVVYNVHGLLTEVNKLLSVRSDLLEAIIDHLHEEDIEIVSPTFMNQRQVNDQTFLFKSKRKVDKAGEKATEKAESVIFDKAEEAERINEKQVRLDEVNKSIEDLEIEMRNSEDTDALQKKLDQLKSIAERMEKSIEEDKNRLKEK